MFDFFKGWRRKAGCMTLGLVCVLSMGSIRSYSINDTITIPISRTLYVQVASSDQHLIFGTLRVNTLGGDGKARLPLWMVNETEFAPDKTPQWRYLELDGFYTAKNNPQTGTGEHFVRMRTWTSQYEVIYRYVGTVYWWFVMPFALISAYLLLWKPHPKPEPKRDQ